MNTYDRALREWAGLRKSFGLSDGLASCDPTITFSADTVRPRAVVTVTNSYDPIKIIVNGPATIVFWQDGTKTVVKCTKGEKWDIYHAFSAALAKKVYGNNSRIHKILKTKVKYEEW